jgi:hypothetical protein
MMMMLEPEGQQQAHDQVSILHQGSWEQKSHCHFEAEWPPPDRHRYCGRALEARAQAGMALRVLEYAECWLRDQCKLGAVSAINF